MDPRVIDLPKNSKAFSHRHWMCYNEFRELPEFNNNKVFNLNIRNGNGKLCQSDRAFVESFFLAHAPSKERDTPGYVYIFLLKEHGDTIQKIIDAEFDKVNAMPDLAAEHNNTTIDPDFFKNRW